MKLIWQSTGRIHLALTAFGFVLFGILVSLLLVETAVRLFMPSEVRVPKLDRPLFYYTTEHPPGINPHFPPKPGNAFRIVVVGDSFTAPFNVQFDDTFSARLERMLNLSPGRRPVEVVNCGVAGNSTEKEVPIIVKSIEAGADLLILQMTLNDPEIRPFGAESKEFRARFGKYRPGRDLENFFSYWRTAGFVAERIHNYRSRRAYVDYFNGMFTDDVGWTRFRNALKGIKSAADNANVKLFVVVFPLFELLDEGKYPFENLHATLNSTLEKMGIPHMDLLPLYLGMSPQRLQTIPGMDSHPDEIAHRLAAERIYLTLMSEHLIPAELEIAMKSKRQHYKKVRIEKSQ